MVWQRGACGAPLLSGRPTGSPRFFVGSNRCPPTGQPWGLPLRFGMNHHL
jgi:hypothetical protein